MAKKDIDLCERCAVESFSFAWARSVGLYDGTLASLIQKLKYEGERALVSELAGLVVEFVRQDPTISCSFDAVTFVPLSRKSLRARSFNQSELLARRVGKLVQKPVVATLVKTRETRSQTSLSEDERRENLREAFAAHSHPAFRSVLLIDDVYTTGATVRECSRALLESGWEKVLVLTLARTPADGAKKEPLNQGIVGKPDES